MILITGSSGIVGQEVLRQIAQTGQPIRAAYQSAAKAALAPAGVETTILNYSEPETMRESLRGIDHVFLVGPLSPDLPKLEALATDEFKRAGVRQVVKLSAMGGKEATFPRQHEQSEEYIKASGVGYTFLRPNGFMQNFVNYNGSTIKAENTFYGSRGEGKISHIDLRDVGAAAVKVLGEEKHLGKTYTLTGPEAIADSRVAEILSASLGRKIKYVDLPAEQMKAALLSAGVGDWIAEAEVDLDALYRAGKAGTVTSDVESLLNRPPISFQQFADDYRASLTA